MHASLSSRIFRKATERAKGILPEQDIFELNAAQEIDGVPHQKPSRWIMPGVAVKPIVINDTLVHRIRPRRGLVQHAILHFHGGAYVTGASFGTWNLAARFARRTQSEVWVPLYRLAPRQTAEVTVPAMTEIYRALTIALPTKPIIVTGESAGGGLALAVAQVAIAEGGGLRAPAALGLLSPWVDLAAELDDTDPCLDKGQLQIAAEMYAGGLDLADPRVSPISGRLSGLPPTVVMIGDDDFFIEQNQRLRAMLELDNVNVTYIEDAEMTHIYSMLPIPEARRSLARVDEVIWGTSAT